MFLAYLFDLEAIAPIIGHQRRCQHSLRPEGYLGLLLFCLGSTVNYKHLCMIFGVKPSVCGWVIRMMLQLIVEQLSANPIAQVKFPDQVKMRQFADMVQLRAPNFIDGV